MFTTYRIQIRMSSLRNYLNMSNLYIHDISYSKLERSLISFYRIITQRNTNYNGQIDGTCLTQHTLINQSSFSFSYVRFRHERPGVRAQMQPLILCPQTRYLNSAIPLLMSHERCKNLFRNSATNVYTCTLRKAIHSINILEKTRRVVQPPRNIAIITRFAFIIIFIV